VERALVNEDHPLRAGVVPLAGVLAGVAVTCRDVLVDAGCMHERRS
jgi:hypothetical protein